MNFKKLAAIAATAMLTLGIGAQQAAAEEAAKTKYPVVLAHGMADFGTCAIDWPLMDAWEDELLEGKLPG